MAVRDARERKGPMAAETPPQPPDDTLGAVRRYDARAALLSVYVRALPILFPVYLLVILMEARRAVVAALLTVFALLAPAVLIARARAARPRGTVVPADSLWTRVPIVLAVLALLIDGFVFSRVFWNPPCPERNPLWLASVYMAKWGMLGATVVVYLLAWVGAAALRKRTAPDAARLTFLVRIAAFAGVQQAILAWALFTRGVIVEPAYYNPDTLVSESGGRIAVQEDVYRRVHGRYTDRLKDLLPADPHLRPDPDVTFEFGYAGDTQFTFTASHPKACEPKVFTQPNVGR
jgi:hypothetical protein